MKRISKSKKMERMRREVEQEFPHDKAMQEIHLARMLILEEARKAGDDLTGYLRKTGVVPGSSQKRSGSGTRRRRSKR